MTDLTKEIESIVRNKLLDVSPSIKEKFPLVLQQEGLSWVTFRDDHYMILAFVNNEEKNRIKKLNKKNYHPFPGLVGKEKDVPSAFRFEKAFNIYLEGNTIKNAYSLSLGPDCTIALLDHTQTINVKEFKEPYTFTIDLAYIISFGEEIEEYNCDQYLKGIVSYTVNQWREI